MSEAKSQQGRWYAALPDKVKRVHNRLRHRRRKERDPEGIKAHHRAYYRRHRERILAQTGGREYGLTPEEYLRRRELPCSICGVYKPPGKRGSGMHIDHDHATGKLRGTLCDACNRGLGSLGDSADRLEKAARYLREWQAKHDV